VQLIVQQDFVACSHFGNLSFYIATVLFTLKELTCFGQHT